MDQRAVRRELAAQGCAQLGFASIGVGLGGPAALFATLVAGMMLLEDGNPSGLACCALPGFAVVALGALAGHAGVLGRRAGETGDLDRAVAAQLRFWVAAALLTALCTVGLGLALAWNMAVGGS